MKGLGRGAALLAAAALALTVSLTALAAGEIGGEETGRDLSDIVSVSEEVDTATLERPSASTQFKVMTLPGPEVWGADVSVYVGETAELTVSAKDGVLPYRFAWYKVLDADTLSEVLFEGENYAGNVYTIPNAQKSDAGVYRIVLTDKYGSSAECDVALAVLSKSPGGGGGDGGSDEGPDIHIVAPADPTIIRDLPVPLMKLPNTGDGSAPALALALLGLSAAAIAAAVSIRRKPD